MLKAPLTQIITITPNPAIDISTSVGKIAPFSKLRCAARSAIPAVAESTRASNQAAWRRCRGRLSGRWRDGELLLRLMQHEEVPSLPISCSEETREDFAVFEETTSQQYRFVMLGAPLSEPE